MENNFSFITSKFDLIVCQGDLVFSFIESKCPEFKESVNFQPVCGICWILSRLFTKHFLSVNLSDLHLAAVCPETQKKFIMGMIGFELSIYLAGMHHVCYSLWA